jgi:hypothetical protein
MTGINSIATAKVSTDLSSLDLSQASEEGAVMSVRHPTTNAVLQDNEGNDMYIRFRGKDAKSYQAVVNKFTNDKFDKANRTRRLIGTAEEALAEEIELLSLSATSWNILVGGEKPECTPQNVRQVLTSLPWLREQAQAFVDNRANFLKV